MASCHANNQAFFSLNFARLCAVNNPNLKIGILDLDWQHWHLFQIAGIDSSLKNNLYNFTQNKVLNDQQIWQRDWATDNLRLLGMPVYTHWSINQNILLGQFVKQASNKFDVLFVNPVLNISLVPDLVKVVDTLIYVLDNKWLSIGNTIQSVKWLKKQSIRVVWCLPVNFPDYQKYLVKIGEDHFDEGKLNIDPLIQYLQIKPVVRVPILPTDIIPNLLKKGITMETSTDPRCLFPMIRSTELMKMCYLNALYSKQYQKDWSNLLGQE